MASLTYVKDVELYTSKSKIRVPFFEFNASVINAATNPSITNKSDIPINYPLWGCKYYGNTSYAYACYNTPIYLDSANTLYANATSLTNSIYVYKNNVATPVSNSTTSNSIGFVVLIGVVHDVNNKYSLVGVNMAFNYYGTTYGNISIVPPQNNFGFVVWDNFDSSAPFFTTLIVDRNFVNEITNNIIYKDYSTDPYTPGGNSDISVPTGDFDDSSDPIDFPPLPTLGAVDSGFITLFNPDLTELQALARYMWTNPLFDISVWKKIFADPMDAILGLSIVPVAVPNGSARPIIVGNIVTDVSIKVATAQFIEVQCGSLNVNEFWSGYLDYEPYTKAEIYLPFCGVHQISVDDVMNKTIEARYHVDILSGACCAYVKCGDSVLYQFIGQCSSSIPISGNDFTNVINGVLSATTAIGSLVATGGASAPLAVPALSATALNAMKPNIEKSGAMGGTGGMLAIQKPYLVLTRPKQAHPENQNHYTGYPSFITENLGDLSGYTEIEKIHLEGIPATDEELTEIETLLKGGVIL